MGLCLAAAYRLITIILMRCGLRISDATGLPYDCAVQDADGAPYLRYYNRKMKREALVPINEQLQALIVAQQDRPGNASPTASRSFFPRRPPTLTGTARSATRATGMPSTGGWKTATSATSTASRSA